MNIKRNIKEKIDGLINKVDVSLIEYLDKYIDDEMSKLEKSIVIYLCLGDVLCYSPLFSLTYEYEKTSIVSDINLDNNDIICKNWAILYHRLLNYYGIFSKVVREKSHYKVEIPLNSVIYNADATGYGNFGFHYSMSDIARIKYCFRIEKFTVSSVVNYDNFDLFIKSCRELSDTIDEVYRKQDRKYYHKDLISRYIGKIIELVETNSIKVGAYTEEDILYRIKLINRFWGLNITNSPLERAQLFNNFYKVLFSDYDDYEVKCYNLYSNVEENIFIYKLLVIGTCNKYYYFLDNGHRFENVSVRELIRKINERNIRIPDYTEILGIDTILDNFRYLKK